MNHSVISRFTVTKKMGEIIFCEYEPGDTCYLIQSGKVKIVKNVGEIEKNIDILSVGEFFGEMALLEGAPRSATSIALTDVKLLEFNSANFEILLQGTPQIVLNLLKLFSKRIYDQKRRLMILTLDDIQARVADVFLMLNETPHQQASNDLLGRERVFQNSVQDIAHWAGLSVAKVNEVITQFVNQHRIEIHQDKIIVKNILDFSRFVNSRRKQKSTQ